MKNLNNTKTESGRSMIEMLGVLAIIGVLSVGGIAGYSKAMTKYRINKAIEQITLIGGNIRSFFAPQRSYEGLTNTVIKKAKLVPDEMWVNNEFESNQIKNVFDLYVFIQACSKSTNGDRQAFKIQYETPVDEEICIELLSQDWSNIGVTSISALYNRGTRYFYLTPPANIDEVVNQCSRSVADLKEVGRMFLQLSFYFDVNSNCWNETNGNTCS